MWESERIMAAEFERPAVMNLEQVEMWERTNTRKSSEKTGKSVSVIVMRCFFVRRRTFMGVIGTWKERDELENPWERAISHPEA